MEWKKYFDDAILKRGENYYKKGKVVDFQIDGSARTANVIGSDEYSVLIEFDKFGGIANMQCNCPYAEKGEYCKHMAAVLFREFCGEVSAAPAKTKRKTTKTSQPASGSVEKNIYFDCESTLNLTDIKDEIKKIIAHYKSRGYIEYSYAYTCAVHVSETLQKNAEILLQNERYKEVFDYVFFALRKFCGTEMDDSDGGTVMLCADGLEICKQAMQDSDAERYIFKKLLTYKASDNEWYLEDCAEEFFFDNFNKPEFYEQKMQCLDSKILKVRGERNFSKFTLGRYLMLKIDLMRKMNAKEQEIEQFRQKNWAYSAVQEYCIEEKIKNGEYQKAESWLYECLKSNKDSGVSPEYCHEQLLKIYKLTKNDEKYRKTLFDVVCFDSHFYLDRTLIEKYKELKQLYGEEEWLLIRESVIKNIEKNDTYSLPEVYLLEGMKDRLLKYALSDMGLECIQTYEKELMPEYSTEVLKKYEIELQKMAESSFGGREAYKNIARQLRKLNRYDEGRQLVCKLIAEWKEKYPKRRAMMEELDKVAVLK